MDLDFYINLKMNAFNVAFFYYQNPLMNFIYFWHDGIINIGDVLLRATPTQGCDLRSQT